MTPTRVLLLGGHGKVAMLLTPLLLARGWHVTSVVRNPAHEQEILQLGAGLPGAVQVLVASLEDTTSDAAAQRVLDAVDPSIVVWSAGAGGKGGPSRTIAIDQHAAQHYIAAAVARPSVTKFLMVSYIASRRGSPPWWTAADTASAQHVNTTVLPTYFQAKVAADEFLVAAAHRRAQAGDAGFQMLNLRPGTLTDGAATGRVALGATSARGTVTRADVAAVADALLARADTRGYFDLLNGDEDVAAAVARVVAQGHDGLTGEDLDRIYATGA